MNFRTGLGRMALGLALCGSVQAADVGADKASRDWHKYPAVIQIDTKADVDVYAIGDPHGDPVRLAAVLAAAQLTASDDSTPENVRWIAGKSVLVVTGDMIDKWTDSLAVIALLSALQKDAASQGGQLIVTMGNHEVEFLADPLGKKTAEFAAELKAAGLDPAEVGKCMGELGEFLCGLPIGVRVNDWFFTHGGNTDNRSIARLGADIESGFAESGFATMELIGDNSILEARLNKKGPNGLPWFQAGKAKTDPQALLRDYAQHLGVKHIVQGHQYGKVKFPDGHDRDEETLFQRYGILFLIDSGMSRGIDDSTSTGGALRIHTAGGTQMADVICANGTQKTLWDARHQQDHKTQSCGQ